MKPDKNDPMRRPEVPEPPSPAPDRPAEGEDGRESEEARRRNRDRLRVGEDHATPEMERDRRGTFP